MLENNGDMRFPADDEPGEASEVGWNPPAVLPSARPELAAALVQLDAALRPASKAILVAHLARLSLHYPGKRDEASWRLVLEDFAADLAELPEDLAVLACARWRREPERCRFWPKPGELLETAKADLRRRQRQRERLKRLLDGPGKQARDTLRPRLVAPERIGALVKDLRAKLAPEPVQRPHRASQGPSAKALERSNAEFMARQRPGQVADDEPTAGAAKD